MSDNRANVYLEDLPYAPGEGRGQRWVIRASALGRCTGELVRVGMGLTPEPFPEAMYKAFAEGVEYEQPIIEKFTVEQGWRALDRHELGKQYGKVGDDGQVEVEVDCGVSGDGVPIVVRCHPDGIFQRFKKDVEDDGELGDRVVGEVKFLGEGFEWDGFPAYDWQHSVEMVGTKLPGVYVVARKMRGEDGELIGMKDELEIRWSDKPKYNKGQIKARARAIVDAIEAQQIPACDQKMYPCGFWKEHDKVEGVWAEKEVTRLGDPELVALAKVWQAAKRESDGAAADLKLARERLLLKIEELDDEKVGGTTGALMVEGFHALIGETGVEINRRSGRRSFNVKDAKADGVDVDKYMRQGAGYWEIGEQR